MREAVREYAARAGRLSEAERLLAVLDQIMAQPPTCSAEEVDREIEEIRQARRGGGRRTPSDQ